jgi:cytochrome P450
MFLKNLNGLFIIMSTGSTFMFSLGYVQLLHVSDPEVVREISTCTSLDFGSPSCLSKAFRSLFGQGIVNSNGATWAHQRKIVAPELYMGKVKVYICFKSNVHDYIIFLDKHELMLII